MTSTSMKLSTVSAVHCYKSHIIHLYRWLWVEELFIYS